MMRLKAHNMAVAVGQGRSVMRGAGLIARLAADRSGVSAAEYALLLGVLAGSVAIGAWALGQSVGGAIDNMSTVLASYAGSTASSSGTSSPSGTGTGTGGSSSSSPGNSGNAPGQDGTTPGQSGSTPASGSASPGQAGTTPGQSGNNPGQSKKN